jgi:hypothetical protein
VLIYPTHTPQTSTLYSLRIFLLHCSLTVNEFTVAARPQRHIDCLNVPNVSPDTHAPRPRAIGTPPRTALLETLLAYQDMSGGVYIEYLEAHVLEERIKKKTR